MEDIYRDTMISVHVIESFEQDGLFEHPTFNRVYLRSFVRSYAAAIEVDAQRALEELERALKGDYTNELAVAYLDDEPEAPPTAPSSETESPDEESTASSPANPPERSVLQYSVPERPTPEPSPLEAGRSSGAGRGLPDGSRWGVWIGIGIVILILVVWMLIGVLRGSDPPAPQPEATPPPADTVQEDTTPLEPLAAESESLQTETPPAPVALGDTMYFTVIAEVPVRPIRIRRDDDLRRPYYIDEGQAALFPAQQRIILEEALGDIRLLVNGFTYPVGPRISDGQLVITRDTVEAFLETAPAEPTTLVVPADTHQVLSGTDGFAGG